MNRIIAEGHEVANHGTHDAACWKMSLRKFEEDILECDSMLQPWIKYYNEKHVVQHPIKWFGPGQGLITASKLKILKSHQYRTALGNVFPNDAYDISRYLSNIPYLNALYLSYRVRPGAIDFVRDRTWTRPTSFRCLPALTKEYSFTTLSEFVKEYNI